VVNARSRVRTHRRRHDSEDCAASTQGRSRILNLFVGVVAFTGGGKGTSESAAYEAVDLSHVDVVGPASGEGIGHLFKGWDRSQKDYLQYRSAVIISAPEISTLNALKSGQASTLFPELNKAWFGESLGFSNAARERRGPPPATRLTLLLAGRPSNA
jgi:hypothetical protein